jgi:thiamine-phosphate pyrophosphorylase
MIREKDMAGGPLLALVREAVGRCRPLGVHVIVNDRIDVALATGADGVHLGVAAIPVEEARKIAAGKPMRIGASTHSLDELLAAVRAGADYATFGPIFETASKAAFGPPVGLAALREAARSVPIPVLALGGVTLARIPSLRDSGIAGVAAISAILMAADPPSVVRAMAEGLASDRGAGPAAGAR